MRELKFRAWHQGEMWNVFQMIFGDDVLGAQLQRPEMTIFNTTISEDGETVFMQYTGLKDCKGKEIYEGDILGMGNPKYVVISWDQDNAMFQIQIPLTPLSAVFAKRGEVIGNIYENPELLEIINESV